MLTFLGLVILISIFYFLLKIFLSTNSLNISIVKTILVIVAFQFIITEALSLFNNIDYLHYLLAYILFAFVLFYIYHKQSLPTKVISYSGFHLFVKLPGIYKFLIILLFTNLAIIVFVSLFYPPNNWDSATCWLARVEHWIQNKSLSFYPTHTSLQNVHQPLSSIIFLNVKLITKADLFLNLVQFIFLIGIASILLELAPIRLKKLKFRIILMIVVLTVPLGILQASATKNDIIVSFFFIATIYFILKIFKSPTYSNVIWFSLCLGFSILTKFSIVPFLFVFLLYYFIKLFITSKKSFIKVVLVSIVLVSLLTAPYLIRNYHYTRSVIGNVQVNSERDFREELQGKSNSNLFIRSFSVIVKYIGHELTTPIDFVNNKIERAVFKIDSLLNIKTSEVLRSGYDLKSNQFYDEDNKNNFILFVLILFAIPMIFKRGSTLVNEIIILSVVSFIFFCTVFPVFDTGRVRYMLPLFFLLTIPVSQFIYEKVGKFNSIALITLIIGNGLFVSYKNELRNFPPRTELLQIAKSFSKVSPNRFTYVEDYLELYNNANSEEKKILDKFYDNAGTKIDFSANDNEKRLCHDIMLKYNVIKSPFAYDRMSHLTFNIREKYFKALIKYLRDCNINEIGLFVAPHFQEYSLWSALNANENGIKIQAIGVDNNYYDKKYIDFKPQFILVFDRSDFNNYLSDYYVCNKFGDIILFRHKG